MLPFRELVSPKVSDFFCKQWKPMRENYAYPCSIIVSIFFHLVTLCNNVFNFPPPYQYRVFFKVILIFINQGRCRSIAFGFQYMVVSYFDNVVLSLPLEFLTFPLGL